MFCRCEFICSSLSVASGSLASWLFPVDGFHDFYCCMTLLMLSKYGDDYDGVDALFSFVVLLSLLFRF